MTGRWIWLALPLVALAAILAVILLGRPLDRLTAGAPPVEELAIESVTLAPGEIRLGVRADGSSPVEIAQVQVDGAWRNFSVSPDPTLERLERATVAIPYRWVEGEAHHITLLTATGAAFEHTVDVAVPAPDASGVMLWQMILVGLFLGAAPVAAGLLAYPAIRGAPERWMGFVLALTVGLLAWLFVDTLLEALEHAEGALARLRAVPLVWAATAGTALLLLALGRRGGGAPRGTALAFFIAFGIGVHNLGEGLAVGAALATGAAALATFLVVGFAVHNVSEGVAIAAPMAEERPGLATFAGLAALAGLPAIPGVLIGAASVGPFWVALCFAVGAGAIGQVMLEVGAMLWRRGGAPGASPALNLVGVTAGLAVMYVTALLV